MSSWTSNHMRVVGPEGDLEIFVTTAAGERPEYKPSRQEQDRLRATSASDGGTPPPPGHRDRPTTPLCFDRIVPVPASLLARTYDGEEAAADAAAVNSHGRGAPSCGYDWELANWGVKWGAVDAEVDRVSATEVLYRFATAKDTPVPFLIAASRKFPRLHFQLHSTVEHEDRQHWLVHAGEAQLLERRIEDLSAGTILHWSVEVVEPGTDTMCLFALVQLSTEHSAAQPPVQDAFVAISTSALFDAGPLAVCLYADNVALADTLGPGPLRATYRYVGTLPAGRSPFSGEVPGAAEHFRGRLERRSDGSVVATADARSPLFSHVREVAFVADRRFLNPSAIGAQVATFSLTHAVAGGAPVSG